MKTLKKLKLLKINKKNKCHHICQPIDQKKFKAFLIGKNKKPKWYKNVIKLLKCWIRQI